MPAYKVPCPRCGQFIMRDVAVCPFCRTTDPFAPARCASCRAVLEDARWTACPRCGTEVPRAGAPVAPSSTGAAPAQTGASAPSTSQPAPAATATSQAGACSGCGAPLAAGARFCTVCGTIAE